MRKIYILILVAIFTISCKENPKKEEEKAKTVKNNYPNNLSKVFEKHGGIENWKKAKTLFFKIGKEQHIIDLHSRKSLIKGENYTLGFDGKEVWLSQKDSTAFKRDPKFYYNLYFYFYAMPFVLSDDGIVYGETEPLVFEGKQYAGIKISYNSEVGLSPEDNYYIYYNPETFQMEWLEYTVTYFSKKSSDKRSLIRYNDWAKIDGFLLPKSLTWHKKDKEGNISEPLRKPTEFILVSVKQTELESSFFEKPLN